MRSATKKSNIQIFQESPDGGEDEEDLDRDSEDPDPTESEMRSQPPKATLPVALSNQKSSHPKRSTQTPTQPLDYIRETVSKVNDTD